MSTRGIIYCLHCISNGKKYIGQTRHSLNKRINHHRYTSRTTKQPKAKLYKQLRVTGWDDFIIGIVEECEVTKLNEMEVFYIEKYDTLNNGLNTATGGGFFPVFKGEDHPRYGKGHTAETKRKISKNHHDVSGKNNPMYGKKFTNEHRNKIRKRHLENLHMSGVFWWNDGKKEVRSKVKPNGDYVKGRLPVIKKRGPSIHKNIFWWNNGETEVRSEISPGVNFIKGRKPNSKK